MGVPTVKPGSLESPSTLAARAERPAELTFRSSADEATANVLGAPSALAPSTVREESGNDAAELIAHQLPGPASGPRSGPVSRPPPLPPLPAHDEATSIGVHTVAEPRSEHPTMLEEDENLGATGEMPIPTDLVGLGGDHDQPHLHGHDHPHDLESTMAQPKPVRRYDSDHTQTSAPMNPHEMHVDAGDMTEIGSSPAILVDDEELLIAEDDDDVIEVLDDDDHSGPTNGRRR